ncbi:hypothetical protein NIES4102_41910 (plasmid) [Chondrocystis sp. NIES-4102]|nr:hypothetical protein NIES4102_41910 [Chondrocystis sp. NIES-4102]
MFKLAWSNIDYGQNLFSRYDFYLIDGETAIIYNRIKASVLNYTILPLKIKINFVAQL